MIDGVAFLPRKLRERADRRGDQIAMGFLEDGESVSSTLTLAELDQRVDDVAAELIERTAEGDRALLLFPPGLDFVVAFLACLRAARVAVPAIPPDPHKPARSLARLSSMADDARPRLVLTSAFVLPFRPIVDAAAPALAPLPWIDVGAVARSGRRIDDPTGEGVAFLQYTSGSTATPKGVRVLRRNVTHNLQMMLDAAPYQPESSVSWLPQFHDMGLIEGILLPIHGGWPAWLMPPGAFLERPLRWLAAIERFRALRSGGPNFSYDLCTRKITEDERVRLDLSSWLQAYCGSEPIHAATLEAFARAFAPSRFSSKAWVPCYGLAEHTVLITCCTHEAFTIERVSASALSGGEAKIAREDERAIEIPCSGTIPPCVQLHVVDPETSLPVEDGRVGEILVQSGSVADGYWERPEESEKAFGARRRLPAGGDEGPFLRTGDLGYRRDDRLFVVGRLKDVLIVRGANHHAHEVERTAEGAHPAIRRGCVCAVMSELAGEAAGQPGALSQGAHARPLVICETAEKQQQDAPEVIAAAIRRAVAFEHGIAVDVAFVPRHTVQKTSSGKLQRRAMAAMARAGKLPGSTIAPPPPQEGQDGDPVHAARVAISKATGVAPSEIDAGVAPARWPFDSLQVVEAIASLEPLVGRQITLDAWGKAPSLEALLEGAGGADAPWDQDLDAARRVAGRASKRPGAEREGLVLVTGGTGLVGRAVASALSRQGRRVAVMARGADEQAGEIRGDVAKPRFGLPEPRYRALLGELDAVIHAAGAVNWVLPYRSLSPTNVDGTAEVIAACAAAGARLLHVSSQMVCHDGASSPSVVIDDSEELASLVERLPRLPLGYAQSKAAAEILVRRAIDEGLDATIVRPSLVLDPERPAEDDVVSVLLRACVEAASAPEIDLPFSVCTTAQVARALALLVDAPPASPGSGSPGATPRLVHVGDEKRTFREVVAWLNLSGHDVALTPWEAWIDRVERLGLHRRGKLRGLWPFLRSGTLRRYERGRRPTVVPSAGFEADEPADAAFLDRQIGAWRASGQLPPPRRKGARATSASRALPRAPERIRVGASEHLVISSRVGPALSGGGLLSSLAGAYCDRPIGVYPATLEIEGGRALDVVLKASTRGDELEALYVEAARASGPVIAAALAEHRALLDVAFAHQRERALYAIDHPALSSMMPACYSLADASSEAPLVLERLRPGLHVEALDAISSPWPVASISRAARAIARLHAAFEGDAPSPARVPWARQPAGPQATPDAASLWPLWSALFEHARRRMAADVSAAAAPLLADRGWASRLSRAPVTLLHNDLNPRNFALSRRDRGIVAYDWELACVGPASRDLAELLCTTSPPDLSEADALSVVVAHREGMLARGLTADEIDEARSLLGPSLAWHFFDRLINYTIGSPIYPLPWLDRVLASWRALSRMFPPAG